MAISQALQEVYAGSSSSRYVETLELAHSTWSRSFFIHNDTTQKDWTFKLIASSAPIVFEGLPFRVQLPSSDAGMLQDLTIAIANPGARMMTALDQAIKKPREPIKVLYRVYLDTPNSIPENNPPLQLSITNLSVDMNMVTATAERFDVLNRPFPTIRYRAEEFPGLVR